MAKAKDIKLEQMVAIKPLTDNQKKAFANNDYYYFKSALTDDQCDHIILRGTASVIHLFIQLT